MPFYAHSGSPDDKSDWQTLREHLLAVAARAAENAKPFGLERAAYVAGLLHDLGKYDPNFQRRLEGADLRVDHSTAGAAVLMELAEGRDRGMAELIGYAILGHHAGLPDKHNQFGHCFERRICEFANRLDPAWRSELDLDVSALAPERMLAALAASKTHAAFDLSVVARLLFSCLVDADFRDTEAFYRGLEGRMPDRVWAPLGSLLPELTARFDAHMEAKPRSGDLNRLRGEILRHVRAMAVERPGLFTLTVPTGGGKTLASLGFALDHASAHGHRRIIYSIPFTSVVDQTADVFREVLGDRHVLEHHSAIDEEHPDRHKRLTSRDRLKLAMEDWAAPIVVTTNVQLFESLFAAKSSRCRKLHNVAGSIIILDEAQTIPRHLLTPCVRMLDTLARLFGCTIVLCTATQPALGRSGIDGRPGFPDGLDLDGRELAPDPQRLARRLRRATIERAGEMDNQALVQGIGNELQGLVIVNSRKHALELYRHAEDAGLDGLVHLTTRQCAVHRRAILADVRERLTQGRPCRVIATSLIEAGVDVDFPTVWRAEAGWDQVMQAAGRCNREGRRAPVDSVVVVFSAPDYPPPREIRALVDDTRRALAGHGEDIQSLDAIRSFFEEVYWRAGEKLDREQIVGSFEVHRETDFAFRSVADKFRMIESRMEPVVIPFDDRAAKAVEELSIDQISSGAIARKLQGYIVQVPPKARELLIRNGHAAFERPDLRSDQFAVLKSTVLYRKDTGLLWEDAEYLVAEDSII